MKVALEYCDYLVERIVATGSDIDALDMTAQVEHWVSSGWDEPIVSAGMLPKYRMIDLDVPNWLVNGIVRGQKDGRWWGSKDFPMDADTVAADIVLNGGNSWILAVAILARSDKHNRFENSVIDWFVTHGEISTKQANCIINPPYWKR